MVFKRKEKTKRIYSSRKDSTEANLFTFHLELSFYGTDVDRDLSDVGFHQPTKNWTEGRLGKKADENVGDMPETGGV